MYLSNQLVVSGTISAVSVQIRSDVNLALVLMLVLSVAGVLHTSVTEYSIGTMTRWLVVIVVWLETMFLCVMSILVVPCNGANSILMTFGGWIGIGAIILGVGATSITSQTTSSYSILCIDIVVLTTMVGILNRIGNWLYCLIYLALRMGLVYALHGFCFGAISTLADALCASPVYSTTMLVVVAVCNVAYVVIQTYVNASFTLLYLTSVCYPYYRGLTALVTVSVTGAVTLVVQVTLVLCLLCMSFMTIHSRQVTKAGALDTAALDINCTFSQPVSLS